MQVSLSKLISWLYIEVWFFFCTFLALLYLCTNTNLTLRVLIERCICRDHVLTFFKSRLGEKFLFKLSKSESLSATLILIVIMCYKRSQKHLQQSWVSSSDINLCDLPSGLLILRYVVGRTTAYKGKAKKAAIELENQQRVCVCLFCALAKHYKCCLF